MNYIVTKENKSQTNADKSSVTVEAKKPDTSVKNGEEVLSNRANTQVQPNNKEPVTVNVKSKTLEPDTSVKNDEEDHSNKASTQVQPNNKEQAAVNVKSKTLEPDTSVKNDEEDLSNRAETQVQRKKTVTVRAKATDKNQNKDDQRTITLILPTI